MTSSLVRIVRMYFLLWQALSKRIHYGKFVAEAKFQASPDAYEAAIRAQVNKLKPDKKNPTFLISSPMDFHSITFSL